MQAWHRASHWGNGELARVDGDPWLLWLLQSLSTSTRIHDELMNSTVRLERRAKARAFITQVNQDTYCVRCGKQPVEWHNIDHPLHANNRIGSLVTQGRSIARIEQELAICTPVCRSCHMALDGRYSRLQAACPNYLGVIRVLPKPCLICRREFKPLRNGMCYSCSERHRVGGRKFQHVYVGGCCPQENMTA